ncbi:MAG: folate-binding protein [Alphaproteobacteria bacterium]|nr:folate-binding protein [Alphaproteobacteria bacterium]
MSIYFTQLPRTLVEISGADQRTFLQGLISQDIDKVTEQHSAYGTLLTPQGKYLHDFIIQQNRDNLLFDCEAGRETDLITRLSRFKLRADVALETRPDLVVFAVFGEGVTDAFGLDTEEGATTRLDDIIATIDPRTKALGCRLTGSPDSVLDLLRAHDSSEAAFQTYDQLRISLQVPDGSRDLEIEKSILLESNIDDLHGIDWDKGCYMGQELTARTKYRGLVKRGLRAFRTESRGVKPGDPVMAGEKVVGDIRSASGDLVLASVRIDALQDDSADIRAADAPLRRI